MKKIALIVASLFLLSACETIAGFGKDVKSGAEAVTGTAQAVQQKIQ